MKKILSLLLIFMLLFSITSMALAQKPENKQIKEDEPEKRVIVLFRDKVDHSAISALKANIKREYVNIPAITISLQEEALKGLHNNPNVLAIEEDFLVKNSQTTGWGITRTEAPKAWLAGYTGKGIKVAVVDTGIATHEDLVISGGAAFTNYTTSYRDDHGHGTHVAGIIGAKNNSIGMVGIAPDALLFAVKVLGQDGSGYMSDVIAGIDWSISNSMDIINMSLGAGSGSTTLEQMVDKANAAGIAVVAAAGNNGTSDGSGDNVNYPAKYESVIAVGATDSKDQRASFSSTGTALEVVAPGVRILSTYLDNKYAYMDGTSMATPFVAGNIALLKEANPGLDNLGVRSQLQARVIDLGTTGHDNWFGYGLIQAPITGAPVNEEGPIEESPSEPVEEVKLETTTTIASNKSVYSPGETVFLAGKVTDSSGAPISVGRVTVKIKNPRGKIETKALTTDASGNFSLSYGTKRNSLKGTYIVTAEFVHENYVGSNATTSFTLK